MENIRQSAGVDQLSHNLGYLIGVYLGDGCVTLPKGNRSLKFEVSVIDRDFAQAVSDAVMGALNRTVAVTSNAHKLTKCGLQYRVRFSDNEFGSWLQTITDKKNKIPECIPLERCGVTKRFLEGLLDSEGFVSLCKKIQPRYKRPTYKLGIAMTSPWIDDLMKYFAVFGIHSNSRRCRLRGKSKKPCIEYTLSLLDFIRSGLRFSIRRKQDRVDAYERLVFNSPETESLTRNRKRTVNTVNHSEGTVRPV